MNHHKHQIQIFMTQAALLETEKPHQAPSLTTDIYIGNQR